MPGVEMSSFKEEAFVLLHPTERISRSYRVSWYFDRLYKSVQVQKTRNHEQNIHVLSLIGSEGKPVNEIILSPQTKTWYLAENYSLVFAVDMNASMASVAGDTILLDDVYKMLQICLESLVQPMSIPGLDQPVLPCLSVTVLACTQDCSRPSKHKSLHIVAEGIFIAQSNVAEITSLILRDLQALERSLVTRSVFQEPVTSQNMLESMLKAGTLGMQLLPRTSIKGIIAFTNGVTGFNNSSSMHSTISEMRTNNISCWIFRAGSTDMMDWGYGLVPECETMSFVASACNGSVTLIRDFFADVRHDKRKVLQKSILLMSFQREMGAVPSTNESELTRKFVRLHKEEYSRSTIEGSLGSVLGCRIREGFLLNSLKHEQDHLEINLCLPLQTDVAVHYVIVVPWPVQARSVHSITISYEAPHAFVCEFTNELSHQNISPYRANAIKRLRQFLHNLKQADRLLGQLLGFSSNASYSKIPSRNRNGMPVFYMPPNHSVPVPSVSVSSSGDKERTQEENAFLTFWRPVCTLDTLYWKKWMHGHKLNLVLAPDTYLPQHVLQPSSNGRYFTLQCRFATTKLMDYLKDWSSFILLENHTFVKFLPREDSPTHFCLVRVVQKSPTIVLHVGCLEGIPHSLLLQVIDSLKSGIQGLTGIPISRGGKQKSEKPSFAVKRFFKPLQKVMVWYATLPKRLTLGNEDDVLQLNLQYLACERRVWLLPSQVEKHLVADALLRKRCSQGFQISCCQNGMITMALQLSLRQSETETLYHALLQYVLFLNVDKVGDSTILASEVWIEPQYGEIVKSSLNLPSERMYTTKELPDKLMSDEADSLSSIVTFYQLLNCCSTRNNPKKPSAGFSQSNLIPVFVPMRLSSLLPHSRVIRMVFSAFTANDNNSTLTSESVNDFLRQNVHHSLNEMFDISLMSTPLGDTLTRRLEKGQLSYSECFFESLPAYWHAWVKQDEKDLYIYLLPATFCSQRPSRVCAVLLQCRVQSILLPYPTDQPQDRRSPDVELDLETSVLKEGSPHLPDSTDSVLEATIAKICSNYVLSFLDAAYRSLIKNIVLPFSDIMAFVDLCKRGTVTIDCTHYLAYVCGHCTSGGDGAHLITTSPLPSEPGWCGAWSQNLQSKMDEIMEKYSLHHITNCPGYYYYHQQDVEPPFSPDRDLGSQPVIQHIERMEESSSFGQSMQSKYGSISEVSSPELNNIRGLLDDLDGGPTASSVDVDPLDPPLFVHFSCSVQSADQEGVEHSGACDSLPTCMESYFNITEMEPSSGTSVQVQLHVNCLYPPPLHASNSGNEELGELGELPAKQRHAMLALQNQIKWILEDEALCIPLLYKNLSVDTVSRVIAHTSESAGNENCYQELLPISFVFGVNRCLERFINELKDIHVDNCKLSIVGDFFVLTLEKESFFQRSPEVVKTQKVRSHRRTKSHSGALCPSIPELTEPLKQYASNHSSVSNLNEEEIRTNCGNIWLVLRVLTQRTRQYVQLHFQRRSCFDWPKDATDIHKRIYESVKKEVIKANRRVNQWYLLKDLLDTRTCHSLLIPESESEAWVEGTLTGREGADDPPRNYECALVWSHQFKPYWRVKLSVAKNMARSVLDAFAVDREDVFVISETDPQDKEIEDIFYMRIFESMCGEDQAYSNVDYEQSVGANDEGETIFSTMDSVSTLSLQTGREEHSLPLLGDSHSDTSRPTMVECLNVALYGITQPSAGLMDNLKSIIQRKLDDSALDILCSLYAYGSNVKLKPQDVAFIQPKSSSADHIVALPVPKLFERYTQALAIYLLQLLGTFTIRPQYAPETSHFTECGDDAVLLYLRPRHQGRGLGLLTVTLVDDSNTVVAFSPEVTSPAPMDSWTIDEMNEIVNTDYSKSGFTFSVAVWEHGNIALADLESKIRSTFGMALLTCFFELFLLPYPLSTSQPEEVQSPSSLPLSPRYPLIPDSDLESSVDYCGPERKPDSSLPVRSRNDTVSIMEGVAEALEEVKESIDSPQVVQRTWKEIEFEKRRQQQREERQQMAESGKGGHLTEVYSQHIVQMLKTLLSINCPGVHHWSEKVPSQPDIVSFSASAEVLMREICWEFCTRAYQFASDIDCFEYVDQPEDESRDIFIVGYCLRQWQEARRPNKAGLVSSTLWMDPKTKRPCQLFLPLDSQKVSPHQVIPFQDLATAKHVFVPRQRLVVLSTNMEQVDVYAYNLTEEIWDNLQSSLQKNLDWLKLRHGLLQHVVLQKMGLFDHTEAEDMEPWTSKVTENFRQYSSLTSLIKHGAPPKKMNEPESHDVVVVIEEVYRDAIVQSPIVPSKNPVQRHGQQLATVTISCAKSDARRKTLEKAFNAWGMKKSDSSAPMSSKTLSAVKELSRIVHFCTTTILEPKLAEYPFSKAFCEDFREHYIRYLEGVLHFSHISETKVADKTDGRQRPISFQRALHSGGILLAELTFGPCTFTVQLFSIERSRAVLFTNRQEALVASSQFTEECTQVKDTIHVHSFSYDQHIRFLHQMFTGEKPSPVELDAISFLHSFYMSHESPPKYTRSRLLHDVIAPSDPEQSSQLFQHVLTHPTTFGMQTLDLFDGTGESLQLCLHWQVTPDILEGELGAEMLEEYSVDSVLVRYEDLTHHFIFVVHKTQSFPSDTVSDIVKDCYVPDSDAGRTIKYLHERIHKHVQETLTSANVHIQREELWKKLIYGPERGLQQCVDLMHTLSCEEMVQLLSIVQRVPLTEFDDRLVPLLKQKAKWYEVVTSLLTTKYQEDIRICANTETGHSYTAIINPLWSDMLIVIHINDKEKQQNVDIVYRKPTGVAPGEPHPHVESEQSHIQSFVNFISSFIWANLVLHSKS